MEKTRLDFKICFFCGKPSSYRMVLEPETKILRQVYYSFGYKDKRYFCCEACGNFWNTEFARIEAERCTAIDSLFERLILKKGVFDENKPT